MWSILTGSSSPELNSSYTFDRLMFKNTIMRLAIWEGATDSGRCDVARAVSDEGLSPALTGT
jgi:hypothetical protein